ncbi:MAG TPA: hypothetical protein VMR25_12150 [Planctomycetaceae bacterium]|jgi:hypothetical protein|nr:hypothetical protein [Planctomycetaceae bacterium]
MRKGRLVYPRHLFTPKDFAEFIHTRIFDAVWEALGLNDDDLWCLQSAIMSAPKRWPVVPGTGGARKIRFSPTDWPMGKRGALRVLYAYFDEYKVVALGLIYPKRERENIDATQKKNIRKAIEEIEAELSR